MESRCEKPIRSPVAAVAALMAALLFGCARIPANLSPSRHELEEARHVVGQLLDPARRDAAFCRLLALKLYHTRPTYSESGCEDTADGDPNTVLDGTNCPLSGAPLMALVKPACGLWLAACGLARHPRRSDRVILPQPPSPCSGAS
jgi:hypothetical protein